jgi:hypothetical protein
VARIWEALVELGISHSDLKPENFIVDRNFDVWLIDLEKVRLGGKAKRLRQRQVFDVQNFLHVRGWHRRLEARAIFAEAFLQTDHRDWLQAAGVDRIAQPASDADVPVDPELSVLVLCENGVEMLNARRAIDSVRDIADEVVLLETRDASQLDVFKRIDFFAIPSAPTLHGKRPTPKPDVLPAARFPWVLVLQQNECVTPFLAKELQQRIADEKAANTIRIPIEKQVFGRSIARRQSEVAPIRLFRQSAKPFHSAGDLLAIAADPERTSQLTGLLQRCECATVAEFVDRLNDETTSVAKSRLQQGARPRIGRATWRAAVQFIRSYFRGVGILSGWTGLQVAALKAGFCWIEETKLRQLSAEFVAPDEDVADGEQSLLMKPAPNSQRTSIARRSKAA